MDLIEKLAIDKIKSQAFRRANMQKARAPHPYDLSIEGVTIYFNEIMNGWALPGRRITHTKTEAARALKRLWRASRGER